MKQFLLKIGLLISLLLGLYLFHIHKLAQGHVDMYYPKFEGEAGSLILGISREHMGIVPSVLEEGYTAAKYEGPILNFAFEKTQSPYGEVYLTAIKKKLRPDVKNGLFILGVTPGGFMVPKWLKDNEIKAFDEDIMKVANMISLTAEPNYEYIFKFYGESLYKSYDTERDQRILRRYHRDGWNEFRTASDTYTVTANDIDKWTVEGIKGANQLGIAERISQYRINGLLQAIHYLKGKGEVMIVRTPIGEKFISIENDFWPDFDVQMNEIAESTGILYLNYASSDYAFATLDGSHLLSEGAIGFTTLLSRDIDAILIDRGVHGR